MLKKTKILVMILCLGVIPFTASNAMKPVYTYTNAEHKITKNIMDRFIEGLLKEKANFIKKWESVMQPCLEENKKQLSDFQIDLFAMLYILGKGSVQLDSNGKLDPARFFLVLRQLQNMGYDGYENIAYGANKFTFEEQAQDVIKEVEKVYIAYNNEIEKQLKCFCNSYGGYEKKLRKKISKFDEMCTEISVEDNIKKMTNAAYYDRICEYINYLENYYNSFQKIWDSLLKKYKNKEEISNEDLKKFFKYYESAMAKIFLSKDNNSVILSEFLEEVEKQDKIKYSDEVINPDLINETNKKMLKDAFIKYKNAVKEKLEQFCKEHKDYEVAFKTEIGTKSHLCDDMVNIKDIIAERLFENKKSRLYLSGNMDLLKRLFRGENVSIEDMKNIKIQPSEVSARQDSIERNFVDESFRNESIENLGNFTQDIGEASTMKATSEKSATEESDISDINEVSENRISEYLKVLKINFESFKLFIDNMKKHYSNKSELSNIDLSVLTLFYYRVMNRIFLDEKGEVKVDEFLKELEKQNNKKHEDELTKEDKDMLKKAFVKYKNAVKEKLEQFYNLNEEYKDVVENAFVKHKYDFEENLKQFCNKNEEYKDKLEKQFNSNIDEMIEGLSENNSSFEEDYKHQESKDNIKRFSDRNIRKEDLINRMIEYLNDLSKDVLNFKKECSKLLENNKLEKKLLDKVLEKLPIMYNAVMNKIFLDEKGEVKVDEFLKELEKQDNEKYEDELAKEDKDILKKAFVKHKNDVEESYKKYINYKASVLSEKNVNKTLKGRVEEYLDNLTKIFENCENKLSLLLEKFSVNKGLIEDGVGLFATFYNSVMNKIFLDEKDEVKVDEFLKELERQDNKKYEDELTEEDKDMLKDAFVKYKNAVKEKLEQFNSQHKEYKDRLEKRLKK